MLTPTSGIICTLDVVPDCVTVVLPIGTGVGAAVMMPVLGAVVI